MRFPEPWVAVVTEIEVRGGSGGGGQKSRNDDRPAEQVEVAACQDGEPILTPANSVVEAVASAAFSRGERNRGGG
jgi:hypothetical protein